MSKVMVKGAYVASPSDVATGSDVDLHLTPKGYVIAVNADGSAISGGGGGGGSTTALATSTASIGSVTLLASNNAIGSLSAGTAAIGSLTTGTASIGSVTVLASDNTIGRISKKDNFGTTTAFTITLASLANSTAGVGRQSTLVTSNVAQSALIAVKFTAGTSPTANSLIYVYLIRGDGTLNDDNAGASDAGLTIVNAPLLGTILCSSASSNVTYYGIFDTKFLGSLGPTFGIAVVNSTGATANATGGNFLAEYTLMT